jgi:tRNA (guanine37-N1)-methyltransferase
VWCGIVSLFPEMFRRLSELGVLGRAIDRGIVTLELFNPREFARDRHRTVDDRPYGGGPGMVMQVEPVVAAVSAAREAARAALGESVPVIYLSPQGRRLTQQRVSELSQQRGVILLAGRYEGIDERAVSLAVDEEVSIGDYVLSGGELPALVVLDAVTRLLPGTLGNSASIEAESHLDGPEVLLSGDHEAVSRWRRKMALLRTWQRRPDLLVGRQLDDEDSALLRECFEELAARTESGEE